MIFVNFKTFERGTGTKALGLINIIEDVAQTSGVKIIPAVQASDVKEAVSASKLEIWAQNIDPVTFGAHTGSILPEAVREDGASGTFINHSEAKIGDFEKLRLAVSRAMELGLKTLVFASDATELSRVVALKPTFASYEPPELIGSRETSVAQAHPDIISQASEICKNAGVPLIVGAGVHSGEDVKKSLELGAVGVALATDVVAAADPRAELLDLVEGFK
jgi:triosephosphate isomerase